MENNGTNHPFGRYTPVLKRYLAPQWPKMLLLAVLIFAGIGLQLINPQIMRYFLDTAQAGGSMQALILAGVIFLLFAVILQVISVGSIYVGEMVAWKATNALRNDLALHCLRLDMAFHKRRTPGELIERVDGDVTQLANFFSRFFLLIAGNLLLIAGILVLLFREDWRVGLGITVYVLITLAAIRVVQKRGVRLWEDARQAEADQAGFLEERLAGVEDIRSNGGEEYVLRRLSQLNRNLFHKFRRAHMLGVNTYVLTNGLYALGYTLGIVVSVTLYLNGLATIGTAFLILYYISILVAPLQEVRGQIDDLQRATASLGRIRELFGFQPSIADSPVAHLSPGKLSVAFEGVSFGYQDGLDNGNNNHPGGINGARENVLDEITFHLQPGKVLGLLGRTGSGKTTLTRLLFRLYDPPQGRICLDNQDLREIGLGELRKRVGVVTQDVQLFHSTLRDNITLFNRQVSDEQVEAVLRELGLWEWYKNLPGGLDTLLSASAGGLSAGEAQLLAFARVFLKDPGLVILDEASSRLDPATEELLERAIDGLLRNRTGLIIAHRLRTVQRADEIMILEGGRIREAGERAALAADSNSVFYRLLQTGLEEALA